MNGTLEIQRIIGEMRSTRSRYKSHDLGFVDSVSSNRVDEWANELEALLEYLGASTACDCDEPGRQHRGDCPATRLGPLRKLTRAERQQGMADRGTDTIEEYRQEN